MGKNLIIEKTSSEEGRYGEVIAKLFYDNYTELGGTNEKYANIRLSDTTKDKKYQKIDCDYHDEENDILVEVKHDTWIAGKKDRYPNGTGNMPYEFATNVPERIIDDIKKYLNSDCLLGELLSAFPNLHNRYLGCNEKCEANHLFLVGGEEEFPENRRYLLKKIWIINNVKLKTYAHKMLVHPTAIKGKEWFRFTYQPEDKAYNAMIIIPIEKLIKLHIAYEMPKDIFNNLIKKFPQLNEYHTSEEIENLLK